MTENTSLAGEHTPDQPRFPLFTDIDSDVDLQYLFMDYSEMTAREREKAKNLVERVSIELALPAAKERLAWNAEDPLASVHYYLINMRVQLLLVFGVRTCCRCPNCNKDLYDGVAAVISKSSYETYTNSCQNLCGNNARLMGGYAGLAQGMGFANEHQGEGTPHGHGFVSLSNM